MKFPNYRQLDNMDCGVTCLKIIAAYYGKTYTLESLREKAHHTRTGVSMLGISDAAENIGMRTIGYSLTFDQLADSVQLPCIVQWNSNHFVVVYRVKKKNSITKVYVSDPAHGLLCYDKDQFMKCWAQHDEAGTKGAALILEPTPRFYEQENMESNNWNFRYLLEYIKPYKRYFAQIFLSLLFGSVISLLFPMITQAVVDKGIGNSNINFVVVMLIAQLMLIIGQTANGMIRSWVMLHITTRVSISLISDYLAKLMRLPISFFDSRNIGDILQRIGDHSRIQSFLSGSLISIVMAVVTFVIYGGVMASYDMQILSIFLVGSIIYAGWIILFMKRRRKLDFMRFQESSQNQSSLVELVTGMQDIKLNNCEKQKRWEWEEIQARLFKVRIKGLTLGQTQQIGGLCIDQTKNILISFLAAKAVIEGSMTLGMMTAMQYIIGQLNAPISQFISFIQETQDAKISLERLNEVQGKEDEEPVDMDFIRSIPEEADIEFKNVAYQYTGPRSPKVLDGINLVIPHNKVTAIVGTSGSGKTTLLKMILGFYAPVEGEILLNGTKLERYSSSEWRKHCGVVLQEGYIFSSTIAENIAATDVEPDKEKVKQAARVANIDEFIESLPMAYKTVVGAKGQGLSAGQRQRLLIARASYKDAPYLILDEATNSLDSNNEKQILENFTRLFRNKTVIIVAHRLSTVKNADNIIVLKDGRIVEQGTHKVLSAQKGYYYELVKNQLELGA